MLTQRRSGRAVAYPITSVTYFKISIKQTIKRTVLTDCVIMLEEGSRLYTLYDLNIHDTPSPAYIITFTFTAVQLSCFSNREQLR